MQSVLTIENLHVRRDKNNLLSSVNWHIKAGEHWIILGANGSGKSSLLKALTGYLTPTAGNITVLQKTYGQTDWRDLRLIVGIVTNSLQSSIPAGESALETIVSGLYAQLDLWKIPTKSDIQKAKRLLKQTGLSPVIHRPWEFLSQGERQRVARAVAGAGIGDGDAGNRPAVDGGDCRCASAVISKPKLLILDEPCAGLDPIARESFLSFVQALSKQNKGPSLIFVTHHVEEILPGFTHALILKKGRVFSTGKKAVVVTSRLLSQAFGSKVKVVKKAGRYFLA